MNFSFGGTPRPTPRWHHAASDLVDFAIVTFRTTPDRIATHLPDRFEPRVFEFADGPGALVSAVAFRDQAFHFRGLPQVSIDCGQINYRTYVIHEGRQGAWFFGTAFDHPTVAIPRTLWGMPWFRQRIQIDGKWSEAAAWELRAPGAYGAHCRAFENPPATPLPGFDDDAQWLEALTHPTTGWYRRRNGSVGTYSIWHPVMEPRHFATEQASFRLLEALGLISPGAAPHSVLGQALLPFDIHTPPRQSAAGPHH